MDLIERIKTSSRVTGFTQHDEHTVSGFYHYCYFKYNTKTRLISKDTEKKVAFEKFMAKLLAKQSKLTLVNTKSKEIKWLNFPEIFNVAKKLHTNGDITIEKIKPQDDEAYKYFLDLLLDYKGEKLRIRLRKFNKSATQSLVVYGKSKQRKEIEEMLK